MQVVPLQAAPNQQSKVVLNNQNCQISVYLKGEHLYMDLNANGIDIFIGVIVRNAILMNPCPYNPFSGDFLFIDNQGNSDPTYDGLGTRYQLIYLTETEVVIVQQS